MAAPTQALPPWLTQTETVVTNSIGVPVTETSVVYVPPTYFGPSIPLGTLYIFGGSTFPPSIQLPGQTVSSSSTTAIPTTVTTSSSATVTPTSSTTVSSSSSVTSATSTSSSSVTTSTTVSSTTTTLTTTGSLSTTSTSTSTTSSASPTVTENPGAISSLSKGQLVGVIVASILGLIFLFVLALFLFLWCKGRRSRRPFTTLQTIDEDYYVISPGEHTPGEGSPRHSGEEVDSFLQRHGGAVAGTSAAGAALMSQVDSMGNRNHPYGAARVPPPTAGSGSTGSSNSNASGYGVLLDRPSLGLMPSMAEEDHHPSGTTLSDEQMQRLDQENVLPEDEEYGDGEYTGAYAYATHSLPPPPRLIDPATKNSPAIRPPFLTPTKKPSLDNDESATLLTARRVRVETLTSRSPPQLLSPLAGPSVKESTGFLGALGLGGLANLGRNSWFKNFESPRNSASSINEKDLESGSALFTPAPQRQFDSFGNRVRSPLGKGTGPDGSRPKSGVSARSGASNGSVYHDAQSSFPSTPLLAPLPMARTTPEPTMNLSEHAWMSSPLAGPPAYDDTHNLLDLRTPSPSHAGNMATYNGPLPGMDVLDMPAPSALNHFSSISSLKETHTGSSSGLMKSVPFPPGLETIRPIGWDTTTATSSSSPLSSFNLLSNGASGTQGRLQNQVEVDVLDEAPPDAELGWKSMGGGNGPARTFGSVIHSPGFPSEQGSLHSMRSHFSPAGSVRSTGSAPAASKWDNASSYGSNSSRPSHRSVAMSMANSLARTGSISSDGRLGGKRFSGGQPSPVSALSAFGVQPRRGSGSHQHYHQQQRQLDLAIPPSISPPPSAHLADLSSNSMSPGGKSTVRSVGSGSTTLHDHHDQSFGQSSTLRGVPVGWSSSEGTVLESPKPNQHLRVGGARSPSPSNLSIAFSGYSASPWAGGLDEGWTPAV